MFTKFPAIPINKSSPKIYPDIKFTLYFDGCSKGNPGPAGAGAVIYENDIESWGSCYYIGRKKTNNEAEYSALIFGLESAIKHNILNLSVYGDSLLVINQINKIYKVKQSNLCELYEKVIELKKHFNYIEFNHVVRKNNKRADELANLALEFLEYPDEEYERLSSVEEEKI